ncbi:MAG: GAF domain-containing protein [Anaerolineales bacterium]
MLDRMKRWLPPVSKDPDQARQESLFYIVLGVLSLTGGLFAVISLALALLNGSPWEGVVAGILVQPVYLLALILARRGRLRAAAYLTVSVIFLAMIYGSVALGLGHATYIGYAMAVLAASILISTQSGILFAVLSMAAQILVGALQQSGALNPSNAQLPVNTLWPDALTLGLGLIVLVAISSIYNREMRSSFREQKQLTDTLQKENGELTQQVKENTHLLDQRIIQLRTLAETSMAAGAERKPLILLQSIVDALHQRLNLSSAYIFLWEDPGPQLVLRAASTPEVQRMVVRGYRLPEESTSLTAQSASQKRIFSEGTLAVEKDNPLSTGQSELAFPMLIGDRCLGVLDIQSVSANAFDDSDILTLRGITQTLAHGLEMARLNGQSLTDREEIRALNRRYMADAWGNLENMSADLSLSVESGGESGEDTITPLAPSPAGAAAISSSISRSEDGSQVTAPLILREQVIGSITLDTGQKAFSQDDLTFIEAVTTQATLALENARLYTELSRRATYLQTANEIARDASTTLDLDLLLRRVVELIRERFGYSHAAVYLTDEEDQRAVAFAASGQAAPDLIARRSSYTAESTSLVGHALSTGTMYAANNVEKDPYYRADPLLTETRSELAIPLIAAGRIIGVLDIHASKPNAFGEDEIAILQTLSGQVAVAAQNARLFSQVSLRAERERKVVEITSHLRSTNDVSSILQTAVSELRRALGISSGTVMVGPMRPAKIEEPKGGSATNP